MNALVTVKAAVEQYTSWDEFVEENRAVLIPLTMGANSPEAYEAMLRVGVPPEDAETALTVAETQSVQQVETVEQGLPTDGSTTVTVTTTSSKEQKITVIETEKDFSLLELRGLTTDQECKYCSGYVFFSGLHKKNGKLYLEDGRWIYKSRTEKPNFPKLKMEGDKLYIIGKGKDLTWQLSYRIF